MKVTDFMDLNILQQIQNDFSTATGLAAVIVDIDGNNITRGSNYTSFDIQKCKENGLDFSVDIILNNEKIGAVVGGFPKDTDADSNSAKTLSAAASLLETVINRIVKQEYLNSTQYKKLDVWESELATATETISTIKQCTKELEAIASKQTIMALNASIETARVGAAGAGFGIIAKQMGEFSKQSSEIYKQITDSANKISGSIEKMNNV